ncbi:MAG: ABC transporter substrate-binding protein [Betaproteobacteria bacterium]
MLRSPSCLRHGRRGARLRAILASTLRVAVLALAACLAPVDALAADKTLRLQMLSDVESLDPARAGSLSSLNTVAPLYHQLLTYDYLARPVRMIPYAAEALPTISADRRSYTLRIRPGLLFAPHPAFGGKPRELVAQDFVYSVQRLADPASISMSFAQFEGLIEGLDDLVAAARREKRGLDYAAPIAGLNAKDARTLEIRLTRPDPTFVYALAYAGWSAVPREVVEAEGAEFARRPIGSGPYLVERFQPGTRLSLVRNPSFKRLPWTAYAPGAKPDDPVVRTMRNVMVPAVDRIEMTRIPEASTAVLALQRGELDFIAFAQPPVAFDGTELKPALKAAGIRAARARAQGFLLLMFNMRDPVVGGFEPAKVALRRAIAMSFDDAAWMRTFDQGLAFPQQHLIGPDVVGYDAAYRNPNGFDPATANALLDRFGYRRDADGLRTTPDGKPLVIRQIVNTTSTGRLVSEFMKRGFDRIGVRIAFDAIQPADRLKRMFACKHQLTTMDFGGGAPDGVSAMENFYSKHVGTVNLACYASPDYDAVFEKVRTMDAGAERAPLFRRLTDLIDAHAPSRVLPLADDIYLMAPGVLGFVPHPYLSLPYQLLDVGDR